MIHSKSIFLFDVRNISTYKIYASIVVDVLYSKMAVHLVLRRIQREREREREYDHSLFASLVDNLSLKLSGTHNTRTLSVYLRVQFQ